MLKPLHMIETWENAESGHKIASKDEWLFFQNKLKQNMQSKVGQRSEKTQCIQIFYGI
jgi:hypothetical protein